MFSKTFITAAALRKCFYFLLCFVFHYVIKIIEFIKNDFLKAAKLHGSFAHKRTC